MSFCLLWCTVHNSACPCRPSPNVRRMEFPHASRPDRIGLPWLPSGLATCGTNRHGRSPSKRNTLKCFRYVFFFSARGKEIIFFYASLLPLSERTRSHKGSFSGFSLETTRRRQQKHRRAAFGCSEGRGRGRHGRRSAGRAWQGGGRAKRRPDLCSMPWVVCFKRESQNGSCPILIFILSELAS